MLLVDENLPVKLARHIAFRFTGTLHVQDIGLSSGSDLVIWNTAKELKLAILTKDADFHQRSLVLGHPPKVVWLKAGNCNMPGLIQLVEAHANGIEQFLSDMNGSFLIVNR